jgi:transcriptional regulator with XRE-family HTH domain
MASRQHRSPTVRHKRLTAELARLRAESGLTRDDVAGRLEWDPSKISRLERGNWSRLSLRDVRDLLDIYGVTDEAQREALVQLARDSRQKGWWQSYGDVLMSGYAHFIGLEAEASSVRTYQQALVPGLLQTESYAGAVIQAYRPGDSADEVDQNVAVRLQRQHRVTDERSLNLSAVLSEGVLRQIVGDPGVTASQFRFLAEASQLPNVLIQVLPYTSGAHGALMGSFEILGFPETIDPDVVYIENMTSSLFLEEPDDISRHARVFDYLRATALSPQATRDMLAAAAEGLT